LSWLVSWLHERGITERDGLKKSGLDPSTYYILLRGGVTIPPLALLAGKNLGMTADEVRHIGKTLDPDIWKGSELIGHCPYVTSPDWPEMVADFDTKANACKFDEKELQHREDDYCLWCGKLINGKKTGSRYCSDECQSRSHRTSKIVHMLDYGEVQPNVVRTCPVCRALYIVRTPTSRKRYCSETCKAEASQKKHAV